jgi:glutamine amidotransferase/cyclase
MDINSNFLGDDLNSDRSSGAGKVEHFSEVFEKTDVEAALAAGIFHREEVPIEAVKDHMRDEGLETR